MLQEFKEFALKGNVIDMAVGVIIGGAFSTIVGSLVDDVFMPIIGMITGGINFSDLYIALDGKEYESFSAAKEVGAAVIGYGQFIQNVIQFIILAFVVFLFVKFVNKFRKEEEATTRECPFCTSEIAIAATRCPNCTSELPTYEAQ